MINILNKIKESFVKTWKGEEKLTTIIFGWGVGILLIHGLLLFLSNPAVNIHKNVIFSKWYFLLDDFLTLLVDSWSGFFIFLSLMCFVYFLLISLIKFFYRKKSKISLDKFLKSLISIDSCKFLLLN
jgi:hypothetical protein